MHMQSVFGPKQWNRPNALQKIAATQTNAHSDEEDQSAPPPAAAAFRKTKKRHERNTTRGHSKDFLV